MWVDQVTGSIIDQNEKQTRKLDNGTAVLDLELSFTDETVAKNVEDAKANNSQLSLVQKAPWVLGILGLIALGGALFLLAAARNDAEGGGLLPRTASDAASNAPNGPRTRPSDAARTTEGPRRSAGPFRSRGWVRRMTGPARACRRLRRRCPTRPPR